MSLIIGSITLTVLGVALSLFLLISRHNRLAAIGSVFFVLGGLSMASFQTLWGTINILGFTFVLNEYNVLTLITVLLILGWVFTFAGAAVSFMSRRK